MLQQFDERNRDLLVNINGRLIHRDEAGVSPFDSAVQGGDAVWEGLRLYSGRVFRLRQHLDRLRHSAMALAFSEIPSHEKITEEIRRTLVANKMTDGVHIRLTLTRGIKITRAGMDPPRHNRSGPTLIVPGRAQAAGLRPAQGHHADHQQRAAVSAGLSRSQDPPLQSDSIHPGQDRSEPCRCG